ILAAATTAITSKSAMRPIISPALLFFLATGAIIGAGGAIRRGAGATFGIAVALESSPACSTTVAADIPGSGGAGSGFRFSTTVGATVRDAGGAEGEVGALSIVITVAAFTSDFVSTRSSVLVSARSSGTAPVRGSIGVDKPARNSSAN